MKIITGRNHPKILQRFVAFSIVLGLLLIQAVTWSQVSAQATDTPTPTETRFKISGEGGGYCGPNLAKLYIKLQYRVINATKAVKGAVCGRLIIVQDIKTKKDYLGFVPCNRSGGPYIFKTRPKELLNYYQLVNVKIRKGKAITTEDFGEIDRYITTFETYYPLDQCSSCGSVAVQNSPPEFIFPGQLPSTTPLPPSMSAQQSPSKLLGYGIGYSSSDMEFVFPTPSHQSRNGGTPTSSEQLITSQQVGALPPQISVPVSERLSAASATPSPTPKPAQSSSNIAAGASLNNIKSPPDQPLVSALGYSLYTLLLVPLLVLWIIWRRSRLA